MQRKRQPRNQRTINAMVELKPNICIFLIHDMDCYNPIVGPMKYFREESEVMLH